MIAALDLSEPLAKCACPVIDRIFVTRKIELSADESHPLDVYIPREEGDLLYGLVRSLKPKITLEVGMANGLSTLFISRAHEDNGIGGHHYAIDPFQDSEWDNRGQKLIEYAGLREFVTLIPKPSHQALPGLEQQGVKAQFVFIDGAHLFDYVITDFLCTDRLLDVGGLIAFDDSDWPAIRPAIRYILQNRDYEVVNTGTVVEPAQFQPGIAHRLVRWLGGLVPALGRKLRPEFLTPDMSLGIEGRCVVLRKDGHDARNSQADCHCDF